MVRLIHRQGGIAILVVAASFALLHVSFAQSSEDDASIRKDAERLFKERGLRTSRPVPTPDSLFTFRQTMEPSVADIVYREFGGKRVAIVVVRMEAFLDGSDMPRDQWVFAVREWRKSGASLPSDSIVVADTAQRISMMHTYMGFAAVDHGTRWKVYQTTPYFPSKEAEEAFKEEMSRIVAAYNSRIK